MTDYEITANVWAEEILSGKRPACVWTRKAVERQQADLLRQGTPDFPYVWRPDDGGTVIDFISCLRHVKGEHAGQPFILSPWQVWMILVLFSWKRTDDARLRRYRRLFLECGKSSGKTAISSAILLYLLAADNEGGAEVVCAARATNQARQCFDGCRDMLRACPQVVEAFGLKVLQHSICQPSSASTLLPVSAQGKSLAGKILHGAAVDELWAHRDRTVYDEMSLGCDKRNNSLLSSIGHAGDNISSVGYELHSTSTKILNGELRDEKTLALIFSGEGFDWKSDDAILAANPNVGVSSYLDTLKEARDRAIAIPSLQSAFRSHALVEWVSGDLQFVEPGKLAACRERNLRMEDFKYWHVGEHQGVTAPNMLRPFVLGLDLATRQDLAATIFCTKGYLDGVEHYYLFGKYYVPSETVEASPISSYKGWAQRGLLITHAGPSNDYTAIEKDILDLYRQHLGYGAVQNEDGYAFKAVAYDNWQAQQMSGNLEKAGITAISFPKNAKVYSPVMDLFTSLVLAGRIHFAHDDEVFRWCASNVAAHRDSNENLFPNKANGDPLRKIDAFIAALYALRLAMNPELLAPPETSDVRVTFIDEGNVQQSGPDGKLIQVSGPLAPERPKGTVHSG